MQYKVYTYVFISVYLSENKNHDVFIEPLSPSVAPPCFYSSLERTD